MSEWQPARIWYPHGLHKNAVKDERATALLGRIVRVRPTSEENVETQRWKEIGCDGTRWFVIHPDDAIPGFGLGLCEHEILTD